MNAQEIASLLECDRQAARIVLDRALIELHGSGQAHELCALHKLAAEYWASDAEQAAFHRTHAYIYALEAGDEAEETALYGALAREGRV